MFRCFGQLDRIHVLDDIDKTAAYSLYERVGEGEFRLARSSGERVNDRVVRILEEGRLYAKDWQLRIVHTGWKTLGEFSSEGLELVELEYLPLEQIRNTIEIYSRSSFSQGVLEVVGYRLEHNIYSSDGRLVARMGKMRKAEGEYLLKQAENGRRFYTMKKDLSRD